MFAFLLLSFFKGDSCHTSPRSSHSETSSTTTTSSVGPTIGDNGFWVSRYVTPSPNPTPTETALTGSSLSLNVHLFICSVTFAAMLAWIAVDNSSFNYRFPFKWRLFVSLWKVIIKVRFRHQQYSLLKIRQNVVTIRTPKYLRIERILTFIDRAQKQDVFLMELLHT